ncbi:MAG: YbaB/EbfC family nucleoid-associated protein [Solirubrobacterales bacterium]
MNKDDLKRMMPQADRMKETLEKSLRRGTINTESKNGLIKVVVNYQQEITDLMIDNRLLDPAKSGALKASLVEALNLAIASSRSKMFEETAKAFNMLK